MQCLYSARNMTKCPLTRGVHLREVSVRGDSTVFHSSRFYYYTCAVLITIQSG